MRAGKAYISSLGTTGVLIASSLLMLAVVGAFVAFDRWPELAEADSDVVPITAEAPPAPATPVYGGPTESAALLAAVRDAAGDLLTDPALAGPAARAAADEAAVQLASGTDTLETAAARGGPLVSGVSAADSTDRSAASGPDASGGAPAAPGSPAVPGVALPGVSAVVEALPAAPAAGGSPPEASATLSDPLAEVGGVLEGTAGPILEPGDR